MNGSDQSQENKIVLREISFSLMMMMMMMMMMMALVALSAGCGSQLVQPSTLDGAERSAAGG